MLGYTNHSFFATLYCIISFSCSEQRLYNNWKQFTIPYIFYHILLILLNQSIFQLKNPISVKFPRISLIWLFLLIFTASSLKFSIQFSIIGILPYEQYMYYSISYLTSCTYANTRLLVLFFSNRASVLSIHTAYNCFFVCNISKFSCKETIKFFKFL